MQGGRQLSVVACGGYKLGEMSRRVDLQAPDTAIWESTSLADHVSLMKRQVRRSLDDPQTHALAHAIALGERDSVTAWGRRYKMTAVDPKQRAAGGPCCDIAQVWNFAVLNCRYVRDPDEYDLFCTVQKTLEAGIGDCDDSTILQGALLKALGFRDVRARVISVDGERWAHVYCVVAEYRSGGGTLIPLDPTVRNAVPGWEYAQATQKRDFKL